MASWRWICVLRRTCTYGSLGTLRGRIRSVSAVMAPQQALRQFQPESFDLLHLQFHHRMQLQPRLSDSEPLNRCRRTPGRLSKFMSISQQQGLLHQHQSIQQWKPRTSLFFFDGGASVSLCLVWTSVVLVRCVFSLVQCCPAVLVGSASLRGANGGVASVGSTMNSAGGCGSLSGWVSNRTLRRWS